MTFQKYNIDGLVTNSTPDENVLVTFLQSASEQTNYIPGILFVIAVFTILFLALKMRGSTTPGAFAVSSFVNMFLVVLLYAVGILPGNVLIISIILFPASLFILVMSEGM